MSKDFLTKPTAFEILLLAVAWSLTLYALCDFGVFDYLFHREGNDSFIFDYQNFIAGLLAFGAGAFVWINGRSERKHQKLKNLDSYYLKKASLASAIRAEFTNIKTQEQRLNILNVLKEQQKDIQKKIENKETFYKFESNYFFFKDEILPVYNGNLSKIGLLDPNVAKLVVITSSLIISAVRQIELVGEKNATSETTTMNEASYIISMAVTSTSQALYSIDICNNALKELVDNNYSRLSCVKDYF